MAKYKNLISITLFFIVWVCMLQLVAYTATNRITLVPDQSYDGLKYDEKLLKEGSWPANWWQRFDANWYLSIASKGYFYSENTQSNVVFFPLYPLLIRIFSPYTGSQALAGVLISLISTLFACVLLYKLAKLEWNEKMGMRSVFLLLLFPVSFYLVSIYTEALFLALSLASFYYARTKRWFLAILFGIALTATRITGLALLPALLLELIRQRKQMGGAVFALRGVGLFFIPLGFAAFAFAMSIQFGDASLIFKVQSAWQRNFDPSYQSVIASLQQYVSEFSLVASPTNPQPLFTRLVDVSFFALFVIAVIITWFKMPTPYALFATLLLLIPLMSGRLQSIPRYMLSAFPVFFSLALLTKKQLPAMITFVIFTLFLSLFTVMFVHFHWIA
ncbi:MAG: hypothetical protein Q7R79_01815 [bacterium]|nr:hypothetical protein [bacterium]